MSTIQRVLNNLETTNPELAAEFKELLAPGKKERLSTILERTQEMVVRLAGGVLPFLEDDLPEKKEMLNTIWGALNLAQTELRDLLSEPNAAPVSAPNLTPTLATLDQAKTLISEADAAASILERIRPELVNIQSRLDQEELRLSSLNGDTE